MKKYSVVLAVLFFSYIHATTDIIVQKKCKQHAKIKIAIQPIETTKRMQEMVVCLKKDMEYSGQFEVIVVDPVTKVRKETMQKLSALGCPLALFVHHTKKISWRLYDTQQMKMIIGKNYTPRYNEVRLWAHGIADAVWPHLTGCSGCFSTKIAYCKEVHNPYGVNYKHIYCADYDGKHPQLLVHTPTVNVAPRWNHDTNKPLLFFSECTNSNIRLVAMNMKGQRKVTSNFDGLNMQPCFSPDGTKVVYCASRGQGNCDLYYCDNKNNFKRLTKNNGNNIAPTFANGAKTLYFCSDFETRIPQLYQYNFATEHVTKISNGGYCASPSYCQENGLLAYLKKIRGAMQVFVYDERMNSHMQLTTSPETKDECSWSPCGSYIMYSKQMGSKSILAQFNRLTNTERTIGNVAANCSYPTWSPLYKRIIVTS